MQLSPPRWLPPALLGAFVLGSTAAAQTRLFDIEEQSLGFGQRVAVLGDTNGDGHVEFLSADPSYGTYSEGRLYVYDGASGTTLFEIDGVLVNTLGYSLAGAGDVNNDGVPDLIAGTSPTWGSSKARVFSGADGTQLHEFAAVSSYFAAAVGAAGDVDDDGWDDVIVGDVDYGDSFVTEAGAAYVFSGRTGELLRTITGTNGYEHVGSNVGPAGDVDADGHGDFYVSAYNGHSGNIAGIVRVHSGIDGSQIHQYIGGGTIFDLGLRVVADRDFDGDGTPDVVTTYRNGVRAYSGADGSLIIDIPAGFNSSMTVLDDLDGDGTLEVAVGYNGFGYWHGQVTVYSGASGSVLFTLDGLTQFEAFGADLAAGDVDGDGTRDLLVGASMGNSAANDGNVYVHTIGPRPFVADVYQISAATGGTQTMDLDAGVAAAGALYGVLGSQSGISPGITLGATTLPLNFDDYLLATLMLPNVLIQNSLGALDGSGKAQASLTVPADPSLVGIHGHHAFLIYQLGPFGVQFASNPIPLRILD